MVNKYLAKFRVSHLSRPMRRGFVDVTLEGMPPDMADNMDIEPSVFDDGAEPAPEAG